MVIRIDGDGCPDIKIMEQIAEEYLIPMVVYTDSDHNISLSYAHVDVTDTGCQNVDIKLSNEILNGDIVVTQDYGVAVIALSKKAKVIHPKGHEYTDDNIMMMLSEKHENQKLRRRHQHVKGPKKRTKEDTERLCETLVKVIEQNRS